MRKRFRLLAAVNVLLWLVTLVLPQALSMSLAQAAAPHDAPLAVADCLLVSDADERDARRSPKHKLPPLATIASDRGVHLVMPLPHHDSDVVSPSRGPHGLLAVSQTIAARFSFVFEACGPPPGQPSH